MRLAVAGRVDDGDDVVGADVALDELPRRAARARGAVEARLQIVEDEDEHAPLERLAVVDDVGRDRRGFAKSGGSTRSIGMSTIEKTVSAWGLPSSRTWKSSLVSVRTKFPCASVTLASIST